jgi:amino acid transporter
MMIVVLIVLTDKEIATANTNVLYAVADKLFPKPWSNLAVLSTILSTIGTIETQILQFSRTMFAMSRDSMLHKRYSHIHPEWQTPWLATIVIWGFGILLLAASSTMQSVKSILDSSVLAIGFHICFYMGLAGFACAWHYRGTLKNGSLKNKFSHVFWPLTSATLMVFLGLYLLPTFNNITKLIAVGGLIVGALPLILGLLRTRTEHKTAN